MLLGCDMEIVKGNFAYINIPSNLGWMPLCGHANDFYKCPYAFVGVGC